MAPKSSEDSDLEVEDEDELELMDDDVMDPDFVLDILDEDLTPTVSGKHTQMYLKLFKSYVLVAFKGTGVFVLVLFKRPRVKGTSILTGF